MSQTAQQHRPSWHWLLAYCLLWGVSAYFLTTTVVLVGVSAAFDLTRGKSDRYAPFSDFCVASLSHWDGRHFANIVENGYSHEKGVASNVAFFPAAPILALPLARMGLRADAALILVSNVAIAGCLAIVFLAYAPPRKLSGLSQGDAGDGSLTPWVVGLWPLSFFCRAAYSESIFMLLAAATLVAIRRSGSIWLVALLGGATTATRPVGVAVIPAVAVYFFAKWRAKEVSFPAAAAGLACSAWGLAAYSAYLGIAFGDPLAFANTQSDWASRGHAPLSEWVWGTVTLQPIWEQFVPNSPLFWRSFGPYGQIPVFNGNLINAVLVIFTVGLVIDGACRRWISWPELLFAITVIAIPYGLHAYKNVMLSQGRYMMACLPAFAVIARHLSRLPPGFQIGYFAVSTALLVAYTALFSAGYLF